MKQAHTLHTHAQTISPCRKNIVLFDEKGDIYFSYSSSTKKRWKYCWKYCMTVYKIIIGGALNVIKSHIVVCQLKSLINPGLKNSF
jgi:hypothetical protein